jgi:hypothetical protein
MDVVDDVQTFTTPVSGVLTHEISFFCPPEAELTITEE